MPLVVQKFGGTSVSTIDRIEASSLRVQQEVEAGNHVLVVVSAMAGVTNQLVSWVHSITPFYDAAEYDVVVSSGEMVTSGLMALALQKRGISARSWQAWQIPIEATGPHEKGWIKRVEVSGLREDLEKGRVGVVSGFQAVTSKEQRVVTLGRGGSDTSAVFLAAALRAARCDIYTDVDGIYSADPRIVVRARKLHRLSYGEVLELASLGAKVLHVNAVLAAWQQHVKLRVLSSSEDLPGSMVVAEEEMEAEVAVRGVTVMENEVLFTVETVANHIDILYALAEQDIPCDMVASVPAVAAGSQRVSFLVPRTDQARAGYFLKAREGITSVHVDTDIAKVSLVGMGLRCQPSIMKCVLETIKNVAKKPGCFMATETRVSIIVSQSESRGMFSALHAALGLEGGDAS